MRYERMVGERETTEAKRRAELHDVEEAIVKAQAAVYEKAAPRF